MDHSTISYKKLAKATFLLIFYTLLIILWGAWVRISGSGDGCGEHWPFCYGQVWPDYNELKTFIENFHRVSTKLFGFFVIGLVIAVFKTTPKNHAARFWSLFTFAFTLTEGLLGAVLVLKGLVGENDSPMRALIMAVHLTNTFALTAGLVLLWTRLRGIEQWTIKSKPIFTSPSWSIGGWFLVSAFGAIAALASTLFASTSLLEAFARDFASDAHFTLRLRIFHPILAILVTTGLFIGWQQLKALTQSSLFTGLQALLVLHFLFGIATLGFLAPVWMKLTHLALTHIVWMGLIYGISRIQRI